MITAQDEPAELSPITEILHELQLYGFRPFQDEPDPRPLPEARLVTGAMADIFDALKVTLQDTRLEPDLEELLWGQVNLFHRACGRIERELDDNERKQKQSQRDQDGSEIASVELEDLIQQGQTLLERRAAFELMRDTAGDLYRRHTGRMWQPRHGSLASRRTMTATLIDSRDFIATRRRAETELLVPAGPKVAFTGGNDCTDVSAIWAALDRVRAKHSGMVLLHGGSPKGAELIAQKWAESRGVVTVAFKPDWAKHRKAAPFKRNDAMLDVLPIGIVAFPGTGIQDNLADKAKKLGIPVFDFRNSSV